VVRVILEPVKGASGQQMAQLDHIALATNHLEPLLDFYRQLGGVVLTPSLDLGSGRRGCLLDFFGVRLELFEPRHVTDAASGNGHLPRLMQLGFALRSADAVDELTRKLAAAGHRVLEPPDRVGDFGRYESVLLDPDGNRVKLSV
jgi:catechol 2,3-dioxygenase-like lactoylglutathione lyase family enzyme